MVGRAIEGVRIVGSPEQLNSIVEEYGVHGIKVDRVIFGGESDSFSRKSDQRGVSLAIDVKLGWIFYHVFSIKRFEDEPTAGPGSYGPFCIAVLFSLEARN